MPIFAAALALATIVLVVVTATVIMPGSGTGPPPVPTPEPTLEPSSGPIPEAVAVAFSRPIPPDERPGDTQVVAVPSPGQVEAEGRKDWPEEAYSIWVECTNLLDRKEFDQAITRMNEVASRSTDRSVRAVTATCRAAAKVNNGDFAEAEPDLVEARLQADSLPPQAELDVNFTANVADLTSIMARVGLAPTAEDKNQLESEIPGAANRVDRSLASYTYNSSGGNTSSTSYRSTLALLSAGVGYRACWGSAGKAACQETAIVAVTALPNLSSSLRTGVEVAIKAIGPLPGAVNVPNPPNPPAPATTTGTTTTTTSPEMPTTTTTTTTGSTTPSTTTSQESSTTTEKPPTTTTKSTTSKSTTTKTAKTTTKKPTTTKKTTTTTKTTTPKTTTSTTTTSNGDGG